MLKEAFDIPDDDLLKISRKLERIFLESCAVRREIPIPPAPEVEPKEVSSKYGTCVKVRLENLLTWMYHKNLTKSPT